MDFQNCCANLTNFFRGIFRGRKSDGDVIGWSRRFLFIRLPFGDILPGGGVRGTGAEGQAERENGLYIGGALQKDIAAQLPRQISGDGEPEAVSLYAAVSGILHGKEAVKHGFGKGFVNALPFVDDIDGYAALLRPEEKSDILSRRTVADHIGDQGAQPEPQRLVALGVLCGDDDWRFFLNFP